MTTYINYGLKRLNMASIKTISLQGNQRNSLSNKLWFDGVIYNLTTTSLNRKLIRWISNYFHQRKLIISIYNQLSHPVTPLLGAT